MPDDEVLIPEQNRQAEGSEWRESGQSGADQIKTQVPEPEKRENTPEPAIPPGSTVNERDAKGNPFSYKAPNGEIYFAPGSTPYEKGFRTESERVYSQTTGGGFGVHRGNLIPGDSVIVTLNDGKQYRVTSNDLKPKPDGSLGVPEHIAKKVEQGDYKVPVVAVSETGEKTQILLPKKEADKFDRLQGEAKFDYMVNQGIIPGNADFTGVSKSGNINYTVPEPKEKPVTTEKLVDERLMPFVNSKGELDVSAAVAAGVHDLRVYEGWNISDAKLRDLIREDEIRKSARSKLSKYMDADGTVDLYAAVRDGKDSLSDYEGFNITQEDLDTIKRRVKAENDLEKWKKKDGSYDLLAAAIEAGFQKRKKGNNELNESLDILFKSDDLDFVRQYVVKDPIEYQSHIARTDKLPIEFQSHIKPKESPLFKNVPKALLGAAGITAASPIPGDEMAVLAIIGTILGVGAAAKAIEEYKANNKRLPTINEIKVSPASQVDIPKGIPGVSPRDVIKQGGTAVVPQEIKLTLEGPKPSTLVMQVPGIETAKAPKPYSVEGFLPHLRQPTVTIPGIGEYPAEIKSPEGRIFGLVTVDDLYNKAVPQPQRENLDAAVKKAVVKTIGPEDIGMSQSDFESMVRARVLSPKKESVVNWDKVVDDMVKANNRAHAAEIVRRAREYEAMIERKVAATLAELERMNMAREMSLAREDMQRYLAVMGQRAPSTATVRPNPVEIYARIEAAGAGGKGISAARATRELDAAEIGKINKKIQEILKRADVKESTIDKVKTDIKDLRYLSREKIREQVKSIADSIASGQQFPESKLRAMMKNIETVLENTYEKAGTDTTTKQEQAQKEATQTAEQVLVKQKTATKTATRTATKTATATKAAVKQATGEATAEATRTATRTATREMTRTAEATTTAETTAEATRTGIPPKIPLPGGKYSDKQARAIVKSSGGAIAWRQGKVGKKDRWDTIINPYSDNSDYVMILGDLPEGATIIRRGKGSARATAQMLRGTPPKRKVLVDSGFQDINVTPDGRTIQLDFTPDPKLETTGDITIGERRPRISTGKGMRLTPKTPRLR